MEEDEREGGKERGIEWQGEADARPLTSRMWTGRYLYCLCSTSTDPAPLRSSSRRELAASCMLNSTSPYSTVSFPLVQPICCTLSLRISGRSSSTIIAGRPFSRHRPPASLTSTEYSQGLCCDSRSGLVFFFWRKSTLSPCRKSFF